MFAGEATQLHIEGLTDDMTFWWQVHAVDRNTNGRYSTQNRTFTTSFPEPPSHFDLLTPVDGDSVGSGGNFEVDLSWQASVDPDPGSAVQYILQMRVSLFENRDTTLTFPPAAETNRRLNLMNLLGIANWNRPVSVEWSVTAESAGDQVPCNQPFTFILRANPTGVSEPQDISLPGDYALVVYPNPFNAVLNCKWVNSQAGNNTLTLNDLTGKQSWLLAEGWRETGVYTVSRDLSGLPAGIYLLSLKTEGQIQAMTKVVLIK